MNTSNGNQEIQSADWYQKELRNLENLRKELREVSFRHDYLDYKLGTGGLTFEEKTEMSLLLIKYHSLYAYIETLKSHLDIVNSKYICDMINGTAS